MKFKNSLILSLLVVPLAHAQNVQKLTLINHYDKPIGWIISVNPDVLPGLQREFTLVPSAQITTDVLDLQKEAYLSGASTHSDGHESVAFWGVQPQGDQLTIHGYVSSGIAYSWTDSTITFCTPEEYRHKNHC